MARRPRIDDLTAIAVPEQPALSPDGSRVVYVLRIADAEADRVTRALWQAGVRSGRPRRLTRGEADVAPAWSPDGSQLAFLRAQERGSQLWLLPADGGEPEQLTHLPLGAGRPVWSPDGTRIAFTAGVDREAAENEDDAARTRRADAPMTVDRLGHKADGAGRLRSLRSHLHVLDVAAKKVRRLTDGDWHTSDPAWSPDGRKLAFAAATAPDADLVARQPVYTVDTDGPAAEPVLAGLEEGVGVTAEWLADGSGLVVIGAESDATGHLRLLRLPFDGPPAELAASLDRNLMPGGPAYPGALPQLTNEGRDVLFCVRDRGCTHLYSVPVDDGDRPRPVVSGAGRTVGGLSVAGGTAAIVLATPGSYGEIVGVDLATGTETVLTRHGLEDVELFRREEREFTISDGTVVQGWLMRDPAVEGPGPLLLDIHGGPHGAWSGVADPIRLYHQELVARGWTVLLLNPRASDGYGEAFYNAALGAWGVADAKDFLEPLDTLVAEGVADPARLAVTGYSYGGYLTCYLTSRDNRFAAAVAGGVAADLTSMAGTSDEGHLISEYEWGGQPWTGGPDLAGMSPYTKVADVRTPTLILHGDNDLRCPVGQAEQWHTALRELGVPTRLVLYPGASHLFILEGSPSHRLDFNRRVVDWVEQYAAGPEGPRRPRIDAAHWQRRLSELARRHGVPGAQLGILRLRPGGEDELAEAAHGVLSTATGVGTTTDSVFQIGSISKVWTTTLVLQLVEQGLLDLDAPLTDVLPELRLAGPAAAETTMRHLLTHTSGIDGDVFTDTGRGDDCLEKYAALLADVARNHPLGATWSYCNSGFSLAGRVIEKLTGSTWDIVVRERLITALALKHTVTLPEEALLHRAAVGHFGADEPEPAPVWGLPRSAGPAGLITASAADVLGFARLHLTGGLAPDGSRVLGQESAEAMAAFQTGLPDKHAFGDSWGLGWIRYGWGGHRLIGHDGNTVGQSAFLRLLPEQGLAVALLTNGGRTRDLYQDLYREVFAELADVELPVPLGPPAQPVNVDFEPYLGTYERTGALMEVFRGEDGARLRVTVTGPLAELLPEKVQEHTLVPVEPGLFVVRSTQGRGWLPATFYTLPTGDEYVHFGGRATPKVRRHACTNE
ncbi:serine hydrolase [Amycolatopsis saalfeldensis]|uniref:Dipeptidyl aminopeptidase/acylaminoacyl peptidase n=1 Tax=Amycolatopsis saalfeldensis TaxID=394193 RepID=A0A1H8UJZ9_9PSEU|nr:serine hydrolase [Amycolatopsis saalfeldensis]SEP03293.1 Dipeptidyl aminopeptidase/acylaminoacyl peptidase [Amycolatopsis saalfeldensis]